MTFVVANRVAPQIPVALCAQVGTILERELRAQFPSDSQFQRACDLRAMMRQMDLETAIAIFLAEGPVASC